jgi:hypothetical protein
MNTALIIVLALAAAASAMRRPRMPHRFDRPQAHPGVENCTVHWFEQVGS